MDKKPFPDRKFGYKQRRPLGRFDTQYPWLFWSRDSKFIYAARAVAEEGNPFVDVWRFNVADGTRTLLTRFEYAISKDEEPSSIDWSFHGLSADGNSLLLIFNQPRSVQQWFRINLVNGKLEKLAIFRDCLFAWQDRSES